MNSMLDQCSVCRIIDVSKTMESARRISVPESCMREVYKNIIVEIKDGILVSITFIDKMNRDIITLNISIIKTLENISHLRTVHIRALTRAENSILKKLWFIMQYVATIADLEQQNSQLLETCANLDAKCQMLEEENARLRCGHFSQLLDKVDLISDKLDAIRDGAKYYRGRAVSIPTRIQPTIGTKRTRDEELQKITRQRTSDSDD